MNCTIRLLMDMDTSQQAFVSGRILGCQSTNHTECYGELWACANCGKIVCFAEGTDNHPELCDDCWVERYARENQDTLNRKEADMKTAPRLKQLIEQIAAKHALDLYQTGAYLNLELSGDRLVIENIGACRISISYLLMLFGEWTPDPEMVVWTNYQPTWLSEEEEPNQWVPIELYQVQDGWKACADINVNGALVGLHRREWQAWLSEFVETVVVPNLVSQEWLEKGLETDEPPPNYTLEQMRERGYLPAEEIYPDDEELDDIPF
ncbi:MAG: hypothetical protein KDE46_00500 [Caldilineaceae bacterium]|nr:hypothetical protein [Caldilineaceae bacterium]